jgi:short-subunit dehydrogenase
MISVAGLIGTGFRTLYSAGKFGTSGFFKALRPEV